MIKNMMFLKRRETFVLYIIIYNIFCVYVYIYCEERTKNNYFFYVNLFCMNVIFTWRHYLHNI